MSAINKEKSNPLSSRQDVVAALNTLLGALDTQFPAGHSRFSLGDTCAHYATDIAQMEGLSRALWGLFPLMASGETTAFSDKYIAAIRAGTDPHSEGYWGKLRLTISVWSRWRRTGWGCRCCRTRSHRSSPSAS
jgi:hypothetical protein